MARRKRQPIDEEIFPKTAYAQREPDSDGDYPVFWTNIDEIPHGSEVAVYRRVGARARVLRRTIKTTNKLV